MSAHFWRAELLFQHLYITVTATGERIQALYHFNDAACNLERVEFASGVLLLLADLNAAPYRGTEGKDTLSGPEAATSAGGGHALG